MLAATMIAAISSVSAVAFGSNLQVTYGVELVPNGGFEEGLSPWGGGQFWTREPGTGEVVLDNVVFHGGTSSARIEFNGTLDWSLRYSPAQIPAMFGDLFDLQAWVKISGSGSAMVSAITYDTQGNVVDWLFAARYIQGPTDWHLLHSRFVAQLNVAQIEIRLTGSKPATIWVDDVHLIRERNVRDQATPDLTITNPSLSLTFHTDFATLTVVDLRTNMIWDQQPVSNDIVVEKATKEQPGLIRTTLFFSPSGLEVDAAIKLQGDTPEFTVELSGNGNMTDSLGFPHPFRTQKGTYLVVPLNEGISYPVEDTSISPMQLAAYAGHGGISMAFWGVTDGEKGHMAVIETPNDAEIRIDRDQGNLYVAPEWDSQKGQFGYPRYLRYVFFDHGGYVAMCKQYRTYAQAIGLLKTLNQKLQENPNVDLLVGAVDVWFAGGASDDNLLIVKEMKSLGMDRILWSNTSPASESSDRIKTLNELGVLTGRYDIYSDVIDPQNLGVMTVPHPDWPEAAWPADIVIGGDGQWVKGWSVLGTDGKWYRCGYINDEEALKYVSRILEDSKTYRARFIDTATALAWYEDYSPDHPLVRSEDRQWRMDLLQFVSGQAGFVTGSETGIDAAVPYVDYFEGMLSLAPYRAADAGSNMDQMLLQVPDQVAKFQVGYQYRLPLWELVYHDCVVSTWYWGDYSNKFPTLWDKRDLFNVLYGTPPMFMFNKDVWNSNKERFLQSYKNVSPIARLVGFSEMTDHHFLSADRTVQQTTFANGVIVTVNFGETPYYLTDGTGIPSMGFSVTGQRQSNLTVKLAGTLNAVITAPDVPKVMVAGQTYTVHITVRNTGTMTWTATSYMLGFVGQSPFGPAMVELDPATSVAPGQEYTFTFTVTAPTKTDNYTISYQMLRTIDSCRFGQVLELPVAVVQP